VENRFKGTIRSVNIGDRKGEKKHNIGTCLLLKGQGMDGDAHAGMEIRQVSFLARESIQKILDKGLDVQFGDFAENFTTEGIILHTLPVGTKLKVGETVLLRVTQTARSAMTAVPSSPRWGTASCPGKGSSPRS
jgi:MOSC domain-containing protein YiiM